MLKRTLGILLSICIKIMTTTSSGGMHQAFKAMVLATPEGVLKSPPIAT